MKILAVDPGPVHSGVVFVVNGVVQWAEPAMINGAVLLEVGSYFERDDVTLAIETMQANYAATVGASVIDTLVWIGRFKQAWFAPEEALLITRQAVKQAVCGNVKANDKGVRTALIDRLGPPGTKNHPGPTFGVTSHAWSALAVAVAAKIQMACTRFDPMEVIAA